MALGGRGLLRAPPELLRSGVLTSQCSEYSGLRWLCPRAHAWVQGLLAQSPRSRDLGPGSVCRVQGPQARGALASASAGAEATVVGRRGIGGKETAGPCPC